LQTPCIIRTTNPLTLK